MTSEMARNELAKGAALTHFLHSSVRSEVKVSLIKVPGSVKS